MNTQNKGKEKNNKNLVDEILRRMLSTPPQNPKVKKKSKKSDK